MRAAREAVATLVGGEADEFALVDNATTAATTVALLVRQRFLSGEYQKGDRILVTRWMYDACFKAFHEYCGRLGAVFVVLNLPGPPLRSEEALVAAFRHGLSRLVDPWRAFDDGTGRATGRFGAVVPHRHQTAPLRLACLDHIPSGCPYVVPLPAIVPMLRKAGVQEIFVDGAHVPGQLSLDIPSLGVDYYCGNLHKWCYCPPAVAFLWLRDSGQRDAAHHPVISHAYHRMHHRRS
jgi:selenocysteine lyase/cysteine desulfurase